MDSIGIFINGVKLPFVKSAKYIGIEIDSKLDGTVFGTKTLKASPLDIFESVHEKNMMNVVNNCC